MGRRTLFLVLLSGVVLTLAASVKDRTSALMAISAKVDSVKADYEPTVCAAEPVACGHFAFSAQNEAGTGNMPQFCDAANETVHTICTANGDGVYVCPLICPNSRLVDGDEPEDGLCYCKCSTPWEDADTEPDDENDCQTPETAKVAVKASKVAMKASKSVLVATATKVDSVPQAVFSPPPPFPPKDGWTDKQKAAFEAAEEAAEEKAELAATNDKAGLKDAWGVCAVGCGHRGFQAKGGAENLDGVKIYESQTDGQNYECADADTAGAFHLCAPIMDMSHWPYQRTGEYGCRSGCLNGTQTVTYTTSGCLCQCATESGDQANCLANPVEDE